jgi:hypothetical protein
MAQGVDAAPRARSTRARPQIGAPPRTREPRERLRDLCSEIAIWPSIPSSNDLLCDHPAAKPFPALVRTDNSRPPGIHPRSNRHEQAGWAANAE